MSRLPDDLMTMLGNNDKSAALYDWIRTTESWSRHEMKIALGELDPDVMGELWQALEEMRD